VVKSGRQDKKRLKVMLHVTWQYFTWEWNWNRPNGISTTSAASDALILSSPVLFQLRFSRTTVVIQNLFTYH